MLTLLDPRVGTFRAVGTAWVLLAGGVSASMSGLTRWPWSPTTRAVVHWAGQPLWWLLEAGALGCVLLPLVYGGARVAVWHAAREARACGYTHGRRRAAAERGGYGPPTRMRLARPLTALAVPLCWVALASCASPAPAPAVELEVPGGEVRIGALLLQVTVRMAADTAARADSAGVLYVDVRARNVGDETAATPRRLAPTLHVRQQSCAIEVRFAAPAAPAQVLWRHRNLEDPCPSQSWGRTLAPGGDWVSLHWREEPVPLGAVQRAQLPEGRYLLSASLVLGLFTGQIGEIDAPPPGPERARWSPDPGLRCASHCTVTVPAGVLRIRR